MELFEAIQGRRSVHNFIPGKKIPRKDLNKLFQSVVLTPSSWNLQPWKFLVIEDEGKKAQIRELAWNQNIVTDCSAMVLVLGDTDPHRNKAKIFDQWRNSKIINDKIHAQWTAAVGQVYPTAYEQHEFAIRNSSFAAMTLMLAAYGMGLVSCPMIGFDKKAVSELIEVKDGWILSFMIALGYNDGSEEFPRQQRFELDQVVKFESL
ncbi:MAG: nitroreductase family protein [Planctomycetes bacterium]|nr:nitroreductase family protein [Planctomycetota bacterium]